MKSSNEHISEPTQISVNFFIFVVGGENFCNRLGLRKTIERTWVK